MGRFICLYQRDLNNLRLLKYHSVLCHSELGSESQVYMNRQYYVYILTNKSNKVLYIRVTNSLERRVFEHKNKLVEGFSKKYNLKKLVYYEATDDVISAIRREKQLKNWRRDWKINLIKEFNPD